MWTFKAKRAFFFFFSHWETPEFSRISRSFNNANLRPRARFCVRASCISYNLCSDLCWPFLCSGAGGQRLLGNTCPVFSWELQAEPQSQMAPLRGPLWSHLTTLCLHAGMQCTLPSARRALPLPRSVCVWPLRLEQTIGNCLIKSDYYENSFCSWGYGETLS